MKCIDIKIIDEGMKFIVFTFEGGHEYDPCLVDTKCDWWLPHMRGKQWFTKDIEEKTIKVLNEQNL